MSNKVILKLQGLSCMHCVSSVTKALESRDDVANLKVTIDYAVFDSDTDATDFIPTITDAGYEATVATTPDVQLQLSGLNCMKCAAKTQQSLESVDGVAVAIVDTTHAKVYGTADPQALISAVQQAGYHAELALPNTTTLALSGLSCMKCAAKTQQALEAVEGVERAEVDTKSAVVHGHASVDALISAIEGAGYQASLSQEGSESPKTEPLTIETEQPEADSAAICDIPAQQSDLDEQPDITPTDDSVQLLLDGMTCASCVSKVQKALNSVPGVENARVNLAERSALVTGTAVPEDLINAVIKAGYGAEIIQDEAKRRERQQEVAQGNMRRFRWQSALALALGIPVMVWGMMGDNMVLTEQNHTIWLTIGLLTLAVMVFAGDYFYRNAWQSLKNGSATMDTLVALGTGAAWLYSIVVNIYQSGFLIRQGTFITKPVQ